MSSTSQRVTTRDDEWRRRFLSSVKIVSRVKVITHPRGRLGAIGRAAAIAPATAPTALDARHARGGERSPRVVAIGASTGGPGAILDVLRAVPPRFPLPLLIVLHIGEPFGTAFSEWLDGQTGHSVAYAKDGEPLDGVARRVVMAPPGSHLVVEGARLRLSDAPERHSCRPSVDVLFESLAISDGSRVAACLLTGMGKDGAFGLLQLRRAGALTIAQDESTCVVYGMPREAVSARCRRARPSTRRHRAGARRAFVGYSIRGVMNDISTVMIVDDSLTVRMDLVEAFESAGFQTRPCATLAAARDAMSGTPVALVVLDVQLPDGDGVDFLSEMRNANSTTPVLLLSTDAEVKARVRGLATGAADYVGKPYDRRYVVARARELLRPAASRQPRVLVIDDSVTFAEALRASLEQNGYDVSVASGGEEGLRVAAAARPAAILVDGVMPGMDGATVIRRIRLDAALRQTPCILLTASDERGAELRALDAGADAFVRKDSDADVVLVRLAAVLRNATGALADETASLLGPKKILAVDDSPTYLHQLADTLRDEGYDVVLAGSGEEALEMLAAQPVDCILLDVMMPGMGGHETCRRVKSSPGVRDTPLIMLTALDERAALIDGLISGADDYITKSGEFDVLKARVRAQIRRRQFEDETRRIREELLQKEMEATEQRAARVLAESRAALVEELEYKNNELEAFSYSVSHDLRAPLRSIDGFSQALLEDYAGTLDDTGKDYLNRVRSAAQRMGELIDDLLQLSRVGRAEIERQSVDLAMLARQVARDLERRFPERGVRLEIAEPLNVHGDARLMQVVLENLLGNAWKFTSKSAAPEVTLGSVPTERGVAIFVRDNGAGFDMTYAKKLFRPFQRLHSDADFPGTGIGLATVSRIVSRHGGRIWAEGFIDQGATFFFTIPTARETGKQ